MSKKQYLIIGGTITFFVIVISIILLAGNKNNWQDEILSSERYQITMIDCKEKQTEFPKETIKELFNKINKLSDNGPWTGNNNICYSKITIEFENNAIIKQIELDIIDNNSIVINTGNEARYYTNASEVISYLNNLFNTY